jgi:hypothetical protein
VIDSDLGRSGATTTQREGFKDLIARVTLGEVGIVFSYEVTRLARNCSDWYPLLDLCGYRQCLIGDRDGVYEHTPQCTYSTAGWSVRTDNGYRSSPSAVRPLFQFGVSDQRPRSRSRRLSRRRLDTDPGKSDEPTSCTAMSAGEQTFYW